MLRCALHSNLPGTPGVHIVALHSHTIGEQPSFYFTHFWSTGKAEDLARAFRAALDAQVNVAKT